MIGAGTLLQQRYKIDKQIGQGGMGAVYLATDERFGSTVAIKETLCMDDSFRKAIEREARLLNSLKHAALPRVSDHFEEENSQFLVMEYVPGDDLSVSLEREKKPFEVSRVLIWADQLLDALEFLHTQDVPVVHRDIKPQNLKINSRGQIILLDFGLAKGNPTDAGHQTAAKSIFGYSRNYASLEQIQGTGTDPRSDLYSLAATLYHLMTGQPPEDALTRAMSVLGQRPDPLLSANEIEPGIPRGVAGVLRRALDLNADERPASALEMRRMLADHESFAHLADPVTIAATNISTVNDALNTRLMPESTRPGLSPMTDLKTEVMPSNLSEVTSLRSSDHIPRQIGQVPGDRGGAVPSRNARKVAAVGGLLLLMACGIAGAGLYIVKPELFGAAPAANSAAPTAPASNAATQAQVTNSNTDQVETSSQGAQPSSSTQTSVPSTVDKSKPLPDKPSDNAVADRAANTGKSMEVVDEDGQKMTIVERPGETVITTKDPNGQVTTVKMPNNGGRVMPFPENGGRPIPGGFDPRQLTPAQRRKLQQLRREGKLPPPGPLPPNQPQP